MTAIQFRQFDEQVAESLAFSSSMVVRAASASALNSSWHNRSGRLRGGMHTLEYRP
jgi:hypothetical protein